MNERINKEALGIKGFDGTPFGATFSGETLSITIDNTDGGAKDRLIALLPGWHNDAKYIRDVNGNVCVGIITDGVFIAEMGTDPYAQVSAQGNGITVADFRQSMNTTPCQIKAIKVVSSDPDQLDKQFQLIEQRPTQNVLVKPFAPTDYKTEKDFDPKRVTMDLLADNLVTGPDRALLYTIKANCTVTLTFFLQNRMSYAAQLEYLVKNNFM